MKIIKGTFYTLTAPESKSPVEFCWKQNINAEFNRISLIPGQQYELEEELVNRINNTSFRHPGDNKFYGHIFISNPEYALGLAILKYLKIYMKNGKIDESIIPFEYQQEKSCCFWCRFKKIFRD